MKHVSEISVNNLLTEENFFTTVLKNPTSIFTEATPIFSLYLLLDSF